MFGGPILQVLDQTMLAETGNPSGLLQCQGAVCSVQLFVNSMGQTINCSDAIETVTPRQTAFRRMGAEISLLPGVVNGCLCWFFIPSV